jgi:hypothetical protein
MLGIGAIMASTAPKYKSCSVRSSLFVNRRLGDRTPSSRYRAPILSSTVGL